MKEMFKKSVGFVLGLYVGGFIIGVIDQMIPKENKQKTEPDNSEEEEES